MSSKLFGIEAYRKPLNINISDPYALKSGCMGTRKPWTSPIKILITNTIHDLFVFCSRMSNTLIAKAEKNKEAVGSKTRKYSLAVVNSLENIEATINSTNAIIKEKIINSLRYAGLRKNEAVMNTINAIKIFNQIEDKNQEIHAEFDIGPTKLKHEFLLPPVKREHGSMLLEIKDTPM